MAVSRPGSFGAPSSPPVPGATRSVVFTPPFADISCVCRVTSTACASIMILSSIILGGIGNVWGVTLGGILLAYVNYKGLFAAGNTFNSTFGTNVDVPEYSYLIYGVAIVLFMLVRPEGLIPSARRRAELVDEPEEENVAAEGAPA